MLKLQGVHGGIVVIAAQQILLKTGLYSIFKEFLHWISMKLGVTNGAVPIFKQTAIERLIGTRITPRMRFDYTSQKKLNSLEC